MKFIGSLLLLSVVSAAKIKGGFTDKKMCMDAYDDIEETVAVKDFYTHDWESMKRECKKAFEDQEKEGCVMVGDGSGGYCFMYSNRAEFESYDTVYFNYVMN